MHALGIRVVPYVTNDWIYKSGTDALTNGSLIEDLVTAARDTDTIDPNTGITYTGYSLDGINIDIEGLGSDQCDDYVDFVSRLAAELHEIGKTVTVAVAANPNAITWDWQASYNYAELAKCCDYLMIMAYDEHWDGSEPGPVGSLSFAEKSIQYALDCHVRRARSFWASPSTGGSGRTMKAFRMGPASPMI
jgi:spore germination protein YaaH